MGGAVIEATVARVKLRQTQKFSKNLVVEKKKFFLDFESLSELQSRRYRTSMSKSLS